MIAKYTSWWRDIMPNYFKCDWEDFIVKAIPAGKRRLLWWLPFLRQLPYCTGDKVKLMIKVGTKIDKSYQDFKIILHSLGPDGKDRETIPPLIWIEYQQSL